MSKRIKWVCSDCVYGEWRTDDNDGAELYCCLYNQKRDVDNTCNAHKNHPSLETVERYKFLVSELNTIIKKLIEGK